MRNRQFQVGKSLQIILGGTSVGAATSTFRRTAASPPSSASTTPAPTTTTTPRRRTASSSPRSSTPPQAPWTTDTSRSMTEEECTQRYYCTVDTSRFLVTHSSFGNLSNCFGFFPVPVLWAGGQHHLRSRSRRLQALPVRRTAEHPRAAGGP